MVKAYYDLTFSSFQCFLNHQLYVVLLSAPDCQRLIATIPALQLVYFLHITILETVDMLQEDQEGCSQEDMEGVCVIK